MNLEEKFKASWIDDLYDWADRYEIPCLHFVEEEVDDDGSILRDGYWFGLTRNRRKLLELEELNLNGLIKSDIPDQIRHLTHLRVLQLADGPKAEWSVEDVDKDQNCITEIPSWISELENLEELNLSNNSISYVPSSIAKLPKLKRLYLSSNRIEYVTKYLGHLQQLETLWLGANRTALLTDGIKSLTNLKELWLDGLPGSEYGPVSLKGHDIQVCTSNGYSVISLDSYKPKNIFEALECLDDLVNSPWIDELYRWADGHNIPDLQFVQDDTIDDNGEFLFEGFWVGLPRDRYALLGIEELDLSWHSCSEIPEQIRYLKQLKSLSFAKFKEGPSPAFYANCEKSESITVVPDWLVELDKLEELDLSKNSITDIPDSIANLKSLQKLDLNMNDIIYIPAAVGEVHSLRRLYLQYNPIMFIEPELGMLTNLEVLWIRRNKFSIVDECIQDLKRLAPVDDELEEQNRILVYKKCLEQFRAQELGDEGYSDLDLYRLGLVSRGLAKVNSMGGSNNADLVWEIWKNLADVKGIVDALPNLRELWCDGLKKSQHGPITLCDEGVLVIELKELNYDHQAVFKNDEIERKVVLECNGAKSLSEKIKCLSLWDMPV
jgi:Leucine-rich repeat (LRR) protein